MEIIKSYVVRLELHVCADILDPLKVLYLGAECKVALRPVLLLRRIIMIPQWTDFRHRLSYG